ncbi:MAG: TAT-variant-translocated molybdopterin oxidoreductase [Bacteroidetes bacterium]|nr:TAT-variant-translocated molybdopterin oxidoreductase [Bacteroidota bacterium]MBS1973245.1 TAT-variant-translocated molybdopterin oxidoreductase [Bacteroidota bacterium]
MSDKKYWQSFGERNNSEAFKQSSENEFKEELSVDGIDDKGLLDAKHPRRDFLKYIGFSTAAAALAASCEVPVRKVVPYVNKPEDITPGVANYYATTYVTGGDVVSIVAKVRDGRPIKIEGNDLSSITRGGTSAKVQASVLDLYDTARLRYPVQMTGNGPKEVSTFDAFDKMAGDELAALAGAPVVLLTTSITSPTTKEIIASFLAKFPGSKHVQYDADSHSGMLLANEATYGKRAIPSYKFNDAKVIVGLDADFLGTWLSPVEFAYQYAQGRKIDEKNPEISKHYHFESILSLTGSNADERFVHRPSEAGAVALALLAELGGSVTAPTLDGKLRSGIKKAAQDLLANKGKALVISGSNNANIQIVVNAINEAIGANGTTIDWSAPNQTRQGIDSDFASLIEDMSAGKVGALLIYDANPGYNYCDADKFKTALKKVKTTISFNERLDETSELCKYVIPSPHYLERWGDTEPKAGYFSLLQPTIMPLFKTRPFEDSLLKWSGSPTAHEDYVRQYWIKKAGSPEAYEKILQDGVSEPAAPAPASATYNNAKLADAASAIGSIKKGGALELVLYKTVAAGVGNHSNNPWLLELPDPITRADWDNYVMVSPKFAKDTWGIDIKSQAQADKYEVNPEKEVVKVKSGNKEVSLPILIIPGTHDAVIGIALGYGRQSADEKNTAAYIGRAAVGVGKNLFPFAFFNGTTIELYAPDVTAEKTGETFKVAQIQTHDSYEGRTEVVKEMTIADFKKSPEEILEERDKELKPYGGLQNYSAEGSLYAPYDKPGIKWGMSIDMNSCIGCAACIVACHAENNVPVVGKGEVLRYKDMHWLRIDRYFSGDPYDAHSIQTVFQPMLCQHCDNAPCENVCPVSATNHSSEGLNQMIYNRCIGTKYCANNCPYKVRRFNWADYLGGSSYPNDQVFSGVGKLGDAVLMMNDDLTRMVLNPDVVVRSRGVMEKCSFCVQRLQDGKLKAKKENRPLKDMVDVQTACQQACPTKAIVFGNVGDGESLIAKTREEHHQRVFYALEELHVLPNVNYLAKIRNTEIIAGLAEDKKEEKADNHS